MDLATVIGLIAAIGMTIWSLWTGTGGQIGVYWDTPSAILVFGGTIFVLLTTQATDRFLRLHKVYIRSFRSHSITVSEAIEKLVVLGEQARREGVLSLENALDEIQDDFLRNGVRLVVDGMPAGEIEQILTAEMEAMEQRHGQGKAIIDLAAKYAPAFGMIGTLMGLVAMLRNMDDPKAIGPGMAVAILTTFYGAMIANVLCLPISDKLSFRNEEEMLLRTVMMKGILSLQAGDNPRITQAKLAVYLPSDKRASLSGVDSKRQQ